MDVDLDGAGGGRSPLVDGNRVTFVYHGPSAPEVIGSFNGWGQERDPLALLAAGPDLWAATIDLELDAYIEYVFRGRDGTFLDPLNPNVVDNGMGGKNNWLAMPGAHLPEYGLGRALTGTLSEHLVRDEFFLVGQERMIRLYQPPVLEPVPLVVVWDGQDYLTRAGVVQQVDTLISSGRMAPVGLALCDHAGQARVVEYFANDATLHFVRQTLLPLARRELRIADETEQPGVHGMMGASLGGLMALYAGVRMPGVFGRIYSQSGSFGLHADEVAINDLISCLPVRDLDIYLDWGRYERLRESNERMIAILRARGYRVRAREFPGGHNYTSWAMELPRGLSALFPPRGVAP